MVRLDVYDYDRRLERYYRNIQTRRDIQDAHRAVILEFDRQCQAEGLSKPRRLKYLQSLPQIARLLGKPFEEADREDVKRVVAQFERNGFTVDTKESYKAILKKFYRWLRYRDEPDYPHVEYPREVRWITSSGGNGNRLPENLPTDEEVQALADAAGGNLRDRAFLEVLDDFGGRPAEMLTLRLKDVVFDEYGAQLLVDGKTGKRRVRIIQSTPALSN